MQDKLFGTLHTPLKTLNYQGLSTDTIDVIVNSQDRTICANLKAAIENRINNTLNKINKRFDDLDRSFLYLTTKFKNDTDAKFDELDKAKADLEAAVTLNIETLTDQVNTAIDDFTNIIDKTLRDLNTNFNQLKVDNKAYIDNQAELLHKDITDSVDNMTSQINEAQDTFKEQITELIEDSNTVINTAINDFNVEMHEAEDNLKLKIDAEIDRLEPDLTKIATDATIGIIDGGSVTLEATENSVKINPETGRIDIQIKQPEINLDDYYTKEYIDEALKAVQPAISWIEPTISIEDFVTENNI